MNYAPHIPPPFTVTVVDLLIKLAVMALVAGFIARFRLFRDLLMIENRGPRKKILFAAFLGLPFMVGVLVRLFSQSRYPTTDLSLEVIVLAGLLGGTIVGLTVALNRQYSDSYYSPLGRDPVHFPQLCPGRSHLGDSVLSARIACSAHGDSVRGCCGYGAMALSRQRGDLEVFDPPSTLAFTGQSSSGSSIRPSTGKFYLL